MSDLAKAISLDPAITARVLKVVNSAFYGFPREIETITRAVSILGMQSIHDMVLATSVTSVFSKVSQNIMDMRLFWKNSVFCGLVARDLAKRCNLIDSERLFVEGLLRDIGHLVMYEKMPDQSQKAILRSQGESQPLFQIEREMMGFDFAQVGAFLMEEWNLPLNFQESIRFHTEPGNTKVYPLETGILHIAGIITDWAHTEIPITEWVSTISPEAWAATNLSDDCLNPAIEESDQQLNMALEMIYPSMQGAA